MKQKIQDIKAVFHGDERYMMLSTYYRQNNYHPIYALRGLIPLFIQIPFFVAAYQLLSTTSSLPGGSFFIFKDLNIPDGLLSIGGISINILPIIMTVINIAASAVYAHGLSLKEKLQLYITALIFLVLLYDSSSGLVFYWTLNNIFSLFKNIFYKIKLYPRTWYIVSITALLLITFTVIATAAAKKSIIIIGSISIFVLCLPFLQKLKNRIEQKEVISILHNDKDRFLIFLLSAISLVCLAGLMIPSFTIASSPQEFLNIEGIKYPLNILYYTFFQSFGIFVWLLCIYGICTKGGKQNLCILMTITLCIALIDVFIFNGNYKNINSELIFDNIGLLRHPRSYFTLNIIALMVASIVIFIILHSKFSKYLKPMFTIILLTLFSTSVYSMVSIQKTSQYGTQILKNKNSQTKAYKISRTGKISLF